MASLSKSKTLFGFTSPRTLHKIIPEIKILTDQFSGKRWSGNQELQEKFFCALFNSECYQGETYPSDPAFAARDRITRAPKSLGFVDLEPQIWLTDAGKLLLSEKRIEETFTRQLMKFQLPSPYHTQSNKCEFGVKPYLEFIRLIKDIGSLSKTEIALFFLQLIHMNKYNLIVGKIKRFQDEISQHKGNRKEFINTYFEREICEIFDDEIRSCDFKTRESTERSFKKFVRTKMANMRDYADAFVRYIRASELVTFQKRTLRLIVSPQKREEVDFILTNIDRTPKTFADIKEFKEYLFTPYSTPLLSDNKSLLIEKLQRAGVNQIDAGYSIDKLKDMLDDVHHQIQYKNIENSKRELKEYKEIDDILNVFEKVKNRDVPDASLFLEWNVWRSFVMLNYARRVDGNFVTDVDGMPLNTAQGNKPDIEIEFDDFGLIAEVTLSSGATQFKMEGDSVPRHYGDFLQKLKKTSYCLFIAPQIDDGTKAFFFNLNKGYTKRYGGATRIIPMTLDLFIEFITVAKKYNFSNPSKLRQWLERLWLIIQTVEDESAWNRYIEEEIKIWAA